MRSIISAAVMTALVAAGCAARVGYSASVSSDGYGDGADLVYVAPGVQVIADFNEPIFYADSFYWRFYAGTWYRSPYHTGGWAYARPPASVLRIDRPHAYVHYRPAGWTPRQGRVGPQPGQQRPQPRRFEPAPRQPMYQPPPRAQPQPQFRSQPPPQQQQPRWQQQPQQQQPRGGPPGPRGGDRRDDRGRGDHGRGH